MPILLSFGFRPFFLAAPAYAVIAVGSWIVALGLGLALPPALDPVLFHGHEMVYGFAAAVVAGFFLTVTPSWTGGGALTGVALSSLVALWLLGRVAMWMSALLPTTLVALVDLTFLPALIAAVVAPILTKGLRRQVIFIPILGIFWVGDLLIWLDRLGIVAVDPTWSLSLGIYALVILIVVMGGRVIPSFTSSYLKRASRPDRVVFYPRMDKVAILATVGVLVLELAGSSGVLVGPACAVLAVVHLVRLYGWHGEVSWREPILWALHVAYLWLAIGFGLMAAAYLGAPIATTVALHALTVGALSGLMLAVMSRAVLGHTGRPIVAAPSVVAAYVLLHAAAFVRVAGAFMGPDLFIETMALAGVLWSAAFLLFFLSCLPILLRPRVDGRPG